LTAVGRLSVIVPIGPGETEWPGLLALLQEALPAGSEVIVVAAGSAMAAPAGWPDGLGWRSVGGDGGRARQLNDGVLLAAGEWLWFLHADTRFGAEAVPALMRFVARGEAALGWFDLSFRPGGPAGMWLNAWGANWRSAWLGMPFGDQGFVLPKRCLVTLGGFDETARYGEDHLLAWSARRAGMPLRRVGAFVSTSARKYRRDGWAMTTGRHVWLTAVQAWPQWRRMRSGSMERDK